MKKEYEMTEEQYETLLDACKPVPYIKVGTSLPESPQEVANRAWERLGKELGFKHMTVELAFDGRGDRFFKAEATDEKED